MIEARKGQGYSEANVIHGGESHVDLKIGS